MSESDLFFSSKPAFRWLPDAVELPLLGVAAGLLVLFTLWTYRGHPQASRRRTLVVLALRLLALVVALLTTVRPTVGVQEKPKIPSRLLIGIDLSESMTIRDEFGQQARIDAVRKILAKCQPTLDALQSEQNCEVVLYGFGSPEFTEAGGRYDPKAAADLPKSDYGVYLARTLQRWQGERFIRGHLVIGDGADNGVSLGAVDQAAKWRTTAPVHAFGVGSRDTPSDRKDVGFAAVTLDPDPVAIKNKVTLRARVNAFGLAGLKPPINVEFDQGQGYKLVRTETANLAKESDNEVAVELDAPSELPPDESGQPRRQIKVRVEIPVAACPGDSNPPNNVVETYLNLNKEGLRVLVVNRFSYENARLLDALSADKRIDVRKVDLTSDDQPVAQFDFDAQQYDVLILGNVTPKQLATLGRDLPQKIADRVLNKGMGLLMTGGFATLAGTPDLTPADRDGWRGVKAIEDILPVSLSDAPRDKERENARYMVVPDPRAQDAYLTKLGNTADESLQLWDRLNAPGRKSARFTSLNRVGKPKPGATVYLWAKESDAVGDLKRPAPGDMQFPLLVGTQLGTESKGRVLVMAAQNTYIWEYLGQPKSSDGKLLFSRFWRQMVLWLAKQDEEDAAAWVRPEFPRLAVGAKQNLRFGLRGPNGAAVTDPKFDVRVLPPGAENGPPLAQGVGSAGEPKAEFTPRAPGEYMVKLKATGMANGQPISGEATARFIAYPEVSDELQRAAADHDTLKKIAAAGGGQFYRIEDLPAFLAELSAQPLDINKPKPKYLPDWRRDHSKGFLPGWLVVFATLLLTEWGLRRWWGMV
jgi:hypothetical protein